MRKAFIRTLCELAAADDRIVLLTGDLGYMVMEPFRERFPARFINVGVAEQNMIGIASGMADAGFLPYVYSIAPFASLRPFEFIRNGPVLHNLPVRIVGMGMGFDYGHAGPSHYATEDIAVLRTLAGLEIVIPADSCQAAAALRSTANAAGPVYYSLSRDDRSIVPGLDGRFARGRIQIVRSGGDLAGDPAIVAMGSTAMETLAAADQLASHGIKATVAVVSGFNPDPAEDIRALLSNFRYAMTVEAQAVSGGLGAFVGSVIASEDLRCRLRVMAISTSPDGSSGSQADRFRKYGLDRDSLVRSALEFTGSSHR
ncbi:MAG TPA: transketolase C-terminal domain-containing protein [Bryobacteraceae bacterium]|nr:transketolase C-terminal domain-containing protein [Bryobacteraceae bacterium]